MRRFEFKEGNSSKFWEVSVSGNTLTVRFGRIGSERQEKTKTFASAALAEKEQDKLVAEKQGKGYKEAGAPSAEKVVSAPNAQAAPAPPSGKPARPAASKPAVGILADLRASKPLKEAASKIEALQRASIRLIGAPSNKADVGKSKLGGQPDFPAGMNWPLATVAGNEIALPFVAQLNLADLHPFDVEGLLPGSGMLYFFYNSFDYGADYLEPANWRVLFHSGPNGAFTSTAPPKPISAPISCTTRVRLNSKAKLRCLASRLATSAPEGDANARVELTEEEWDAYAQLLNELRANKNIHQMLGYSDDVQPYAMENGYGNVRDRFFPGSSPFSSLDNREKYKEYFQGRLLLQISEEKSIKMQFGRGGRLFFFIREQDLKVKDFSKVWVTEQ